jgi:predicted dienelactone hydrolase
VILAVLGGGLYLTVQALAGGPASARTHGGGPSATPHVSVTPSRTAQPPPPPVGRLGYYPVTERPYTFTEPASAHHGRRKLHLTVQLPVLSPALTARLPAAGAFPLVVFAPGFLQCGGAYRYLLRQWASAGYVVAAVDFPRTNCRTANPDEADLSNQPADMAYVIRQLLAKSRQHQGSLSGLISDTNIAVAGHSDGGDTVAAMAAASCCKDNNIRAAIVLAGAKSPLLRGRWFAGHTPPMLFVQGTADTCNPPQASVQLYQTDKTGTRYYLQLFRANHLTPYEGNASPEPIVARVTLAFLDQYVSGKQGPIAAMQRAGHVPGAAELLTAGEMPQVDSPPSPHC